MAGSESLICASVDGPEPFTLTTQLCSGKACTWFVKGSCSAALQTAEEYRKRYEPIETPLPPCAIAARCHWDVAAVANGDRACPPRSLGLLCQHQADGTNDDIAIWNTFDMADPDDEEVWGLRAAQ